MLILSLNMISSEKENEYTESEGNIKRKLIELKKCLLFLLLLVIIIICRELFKNVNLFKILLGRQKVKKKTFQTFLNTNLYLVQNDVCIKFARSSVRKISNLDTIWDDMQF